MKAPQVLRVRPIAVLAGSLTVAGIALTLALRYGLYGFFWVCVAAGSIAFLSSGAAFSAAIHGLAKSRIESVWIQMQYIAVALLAVVVFLGFLGTIVGWIVLASLTKGRH
jgi:hypothetical protein